MIKSVADYFSVADTDLPEIVDLRYLEAPEPIEKILTACALLEPDEYFLARLPHVPFPLFPLLESRALIWQICEEAENSVLILIRKGP